MTIPEIPYDSIFLLESLIENETTKVRSPIETTTSPSIASMGVGIIPPVQFAAGRVLRPNPKLHSCDDDWLIIAANAANVNARLRQKNDQK